MPRAPFIVFEGTDRSGKSTQTRLYAEFLRKTGVKVCEGAPWRFPDRTTDIGKMISAYLSNSTNLADNTLHLLFSANRWEKAALLRQQLESGHTVIVDRYAFSGVAYSTAKGLPFDWCRAPDHGLPAPDVVVYLNLSLDATRRRAGYGDERYENDEMQANVSRAFAKLSTDNWHFVDADADEETVFGRVLSKITQALEHVDLNQPVKTLW